MRLSELIVYHAWGSPNLELSSSTFQCCPIFPGEENKKVTKILHIWMKLCASKYLLKNSSVYIYENFSGPFEHYMIKKNWLHPNRLIHHESWVFSCEIQSTFSLELNPAEEHMQIVDIKIYDRRYWSRPYSSCSKFVGNLTLEILFVKFLHFAFIWWQLWSNQTDICT